MMENAKPGAVPKSRLKLAHEHLISIAAVLVCSLISAPLRTRLPVTNFAMIYLMGVIFVAWRCRRSVAMVNAVLSVTAFYYIVIPRHDSFVLEDSTYIITLIAMLAVAFIIDNFTFAIRTEAARAAQAEVKVESERMRNALLSAVSHDIKTPLASIYGAATTLLEEEGRLASSDRLELARSIATESERLNRLVVNLLDMSRIDSGVELKRQWHSLEELIGLALSRLEGDLIHRSVLTNIPPDLPLILVDGALMEGVFVNVLENAVKYTPADSPIYIDASKIGQSVVVVIRDGGPGFPPGEEERIFQKFFRGRGNSVRGAGLGLAICRAIVERHDGAISARNNPEGGGAIRIELPTGGLPPKLNLAENPNL